MGYKIVSGRYELGTQEQQEGYQQLFGEDNIQYKFDLYFHWYNLAHEFGHCLLDHKGICLGGVKEEMFVNQLSVGYWLWHQDQERLAELKKMLEEVLQQMPDVVPEAMEFEQYFEQIWGTETLNNVMLYGYFQLESVLKALKMQEPLTDVLAKVGWKAEVHIDKASSTNRIGAESAAEVLEEILHNFVQMGIDCPLIELELVENPMIQCAKNE